MNTIEVKDVHKKFKVYLDKSNTMKERLLFWKRSQNEERWVLQGINFSVKQGEAVGLIGQNGSGKSTLLKLLSKIMYPEQGEIQTRGRVSSLLELGAGFHPDMSGRENIYINAAIFGLNRKEIDKRLQDIIDFADLGNYIDNPVRTYSSGMYMRLAFAVAINVDADILLIDEILGVGDANFQAKCFNKLREIKKDGCTIIVVSHSLGQIEQICDRSVWIDKGVVKMLGTPYDVHPAYLEFMGKLHHGQNDIFDVDKNERWGNGEIRIKSVELRDKDDLIKHQFLTGEQISVIVAYEGKEKSVEIGIQIFRNDGLNCYGSTTLGDHFDWIPLKISGEFQCSFFSVCLLEGEYSIDLAIKDQDGFDCDYYKGAASFIMKNNIKDVGVCQLKHQWIFN